MSRIKRLSFMMKEIQEIVKLRHEALQDLLHASENVLDLVNTYKKCDGTEQEFNVLRVIVNNAKQIK